MEPRVGIGPHAARQLLKLSHKRQGPARLHSKNLAERPGGCPVLLMSLESHGENVGAGTATAHLVIERHTALAQSIVKILAIAR